MNYWIGLGRMVRDPEVRYTQSGKLVAQFTIAINRPYKNAEGNYDADFINCVAWGKIGERIGNTVHKGQRLLVEGAIQVRSYEGKDGVKRTATEINVNNFEYVERAPGNNSFADAFTGEDSDRFNSSNIPF